MIARRVSTQLLLGVVSDRVHGIDGAFGLPRRFFCFIRGVQDRGRAIQSKVDADRFFEFRVVGMFGVFQRSFKDYF